MKMLKYFVYLCTSIYVYSCCICMFTKFKKSCIILSSPYNYN